MVLVRSSLHNRKYSQNIRHNGPISPDLVICHVLMVRSVQGHLILVILKIKSLLPHGGQLTRPETVVGAAHFLNQTLIIIHTLVGTL